MPQRAINYFNDQQNVPHQLFLGPSGKPWASVVRTSTETPQDVSPDRREETRYEQCSHARSHRHPSFRRLAQPSSRLAATLVLQDAQRSLYSGSVAPPKSGRDRGVALLRHRTSESDPEPQPMPREPRDHPGPAEQRPNAEPVRFRLPI